MVFAYNVLGLLQLQHEYVIILSIDITLVSGKSNIIRPILN